MSGIQAVIFNLYGTQFYLAKETKPYMRLFRELGFRTPEQSKYARRIALSESFDDLGGFVKRMNPDANIDLTTYEKEIADEIASAALYPETITVLEELRKRNIKLGMISNLASSYKAPFFNLGLDKYFEPDKTLFSDEVGYVKKDPRIYWLMLERLNVNPANALMTGDKVTNDVIGPQAIGINAIHLDRSKPSSDISISTLEGVLRFI